ncbi:fatty acid desaturase [Lysinibacillus sp. RC46]
MPIQYKYMLVFIFLNLVWIDSVTIVGYEQLAVILVAVYEVLQKPMYSSKMAFKQVLLLYISTTVGTLLYLNINSWILITILAMLLMFILLHIVGIRLPAVYAFPLLTFVLPADIVTSLPVGILVATVFFFGSVLAIKKWEMTRNKKRMQ